MKRFKKFGKRFLSVALVAMSVFAVAMPASAASVYGINMTLKDGLYCRTQPNATAPSLGTYDNGAQITVLDTSGDWWLTKWTSSQNGYVSKELVVVPGNIVSINGTDVNIRSTSSTSRTIIAKPQNGATFTVVDVTTQWVKIQVNTTTTGWVRWDYLKKAGNGTVGQIKVGSFDGYTNGV